VQTKHTPHPSLRSTPQYAAMPATNHGKSLLARSRSIQVARESVEDSLSVLKRQVGSLSRTTSAPLCCRPFRKAPTDRQTPEPIAQVLVVDAKHLSEDGDAHERRGKRDSLKRNRTELVIVDWHVREKHNRRSISSWTYLTSPPSRSKVANSGHCLSRLTAFKTP
jgi:hypothetical protein